MRALPAHKNMENFARKRRGIFPLVPLRSQLWSIRVGQHRVANLCHFQKTTAPDNAV